jgi:hypothetical protein
MTTKKNEGQPTAKGTKTTPSAEPLPLGPSPTEQVITGAKALALVTAVAFANQASKVAMKTVFSADPTYRDFGKLTLAALVPPALLPSIPEHFALLTMGVILAAGPATINHYALQFAEAGDLKQGPLYTHFAVAVPTMFLASWLLQSWGVSLTSSHFVFEC